MNVSFRALSLACVVASVVAACSSSPTPSGSATPTGFAISSGSSGGAGSLTAVAGDSLKLQVVQTMSDGTTTAVPSTATITWTAPAPITSLSSDSTADSPLPAPGAQPTGTFVNNALRTDRPADLGGVLFVLDPGAAGGKLAVSATVSGGGLSGSASASIAVSATPAGDATQGKVLYVANCASCHGTTGHGSPASTSDDAGADQGGSAGTFTIAGMTYPYPAPGLNAEPGNCGSDPAWNAALFAFAARSDVDNGGLTLRAPMPDWLSEKSSTGAALTTQNFADIFAFMQTQTQ